jgi:hypothetical protein
MPYITDRLTVIGSGGNILVRNTEGQWNLYQPNSEEVQAYAQLISQNVNTTSMDPGLMNSSPQIQKAKPSGVAIASIVLSTVTLASLIVILSGLLTVKACLKRKSKNVSRKDYESPDNKQSFIT